MKDHAEHFLHDLDFFSGLPPEDVAAFQTALAVKTYAKGRQLFLQGDKADRLFVILDGWVKLYRGTEEGEEAVVALFTRGDLFGEAAVFEGANYPFSAAAAEEARVAEIPAAILRARVKGNPAILARVMESMSREIKKLQMENEHQHLMDAPGRVGCLLLQMSADMIGKGGTFSFPYDKSLAAQRLGMTPETFSRALAQLKEAGVRVKGPEVAIENFAALAKHSCGHCSAQSEECKGAQLRREKP